MTAAPIAMIVGAPVSAGLLALDGWLGLRGWQWLFLIEGLPAVLLGIVTLWYLTDRPEQATWLSHAEGREWLSVEMARGGRRGAGASRAWVWELRNLLAAGYGCAVDRIYFLNALVTYGVFLWLPPGILRDASGFSGLRLGARSPRSRSSPRSWRWFS